MTNEAKMWKLIKTVGISLFIVITVLSTFGTVATGERGIKTRFNKVVGVIEPGLYFKLPFVEKVSIMDVKALTINYDKNGSEGDAADTSLLFGASKDLQDVKMGVVVTYRLDETKVVDIFSSYSSTENFQANVLEAIVRQTVKTVSGQYAAEELVTKRLEVNDKVTKELTDKFAEKNVTLVLANITSFDFSPEFTLAIEAKVTAVQNAEAAKNKLEQVKFEAQQTIESAKAQAESIRIQAQAINSQGGADYVALQAIAKWNGVLPVQMIPGSTVPFINLTK